MTHILGQHDVCIFGHLRIWAERGLICIEDSRDNSYESIAVRSALHRVQAISDMLRNSRSELKEYDVMANAEYDRHAKMLEEMIHICRKAQIQGMPSDPSAVRDLRRRQPKSVVVPGLKSEM